MFDICFQSIFLKPLVRKGFRKINTYSFLKQIVYPMFTTPLYGADQVDKIGNSIIYLADRINDLSKTKLLKLIYLIEETAVKRWGLPFFNIRFDVWKLGPVSRDLYEETSHRLIGLEKYIEKTSCDNSTYINSKADFNDDEFNGAELKLLEEIVNKFGDKSAKKLIDFTHQKESLWTKTAKEHKVLIDLQKGNRTNTDIEIDISQLIDEDWKKERYHSQVSFLNHSKITSPLCL